MIEFVSFFIFILLFFVLVIKNIKLNLKIISMSKDILQLSVDKNILAEKLFEVSAKSLIKEETDSEAFLKFISESREWAFDYIEKAQGEIKEFIDSVGPDIEYMDVYRPPLISEEATHRLVNSYKKLKNLLPELEK